MLLPLIGAEPVGYKYWSEADLKALTKTMESKVNAQKVALQPLGAFGPDRALMVHREGSGEAELHETDADLIVVETGAGTLIVGGTMPGAKKTAPGEQRAPALEGGNRQKIAPGDILHVPPKLPHQVLVDGAQITYFVLKVKE